MDRLVLLLPLLTLVAGAFASNANSNVVCNSTTSPLLRLAGQHLHISELEWSPFGIYDASKTGKEQWTGLDIELLKRVAATLKFTYTLHKMERQTSETWTQAVQRAANSNDLVLSYWLHNPERRQVMMQLVGHVAADQMLVTKKAAEEDPPFTETMVTFLKPFSEDLWLSILAVIVVAGITMFILDGIDSERSWQQLLGKLAGSIYAAAQLFVATGAASPRNGLARVFMICYGFTILVLLACYTASMASFLTVSAQPANTINSIDDVLNQGIVACMSSSMLVSQKAIKILYPQLQIQGYPDEELAAVLKDGRCKAVITDGAQLAIFETKKENCHLRVVGQPLLKGAGGWVTGLSNLCIGNTIDYAMQREIDNAVVQTEWASWMAEAICTAGSSRRNGLASPPQLTDHTRRKGGAGGAAANGEGDTTQLKLKDMAGLFISFAIAVVLVLLTKVGAVLLVCNDKSEVPLSNEEVMHQKVDSLMASMAFLMELNETQAALNKTQAEKINQMELDLQTVVTTGHTQEEVLHSVATDVKKSAPAEQQRLVQRPMDLSDFASDFCTNRRSNLPATMADLTMGERQSGLDSDGAWWALSAPPALEK